MFNFFGESEKEKKRRILAQNRAAGKHAQNWYEATAWVRGKILKKRRTGKDYDEWSVDLQGRKKNRRAVEIKSSRTALMTKKQKALKKKMKRRYKKVVIQNPVWPF